MSDYIDLLERTSNIRLVPHPDPGDELAVLKWGEDAHAAWGEEAFETPMRKKAMKPPPMTSNSKLVYPSASRRLKTVSPDHKISPTCLLEGVVTIWKLGRTVCVYSMVQRRDKEKDSRYIQEASAPAAVTVYQTCNIMYICNRCES
jgi:hypothetical protein